MVLSADAHEHDTERMTPRFDHYAFAHIVFMHFAQELGPALVGLLCGDAADEILEDIWTGTVRLCAGRGVEPTMNPSEVVLHEVSTMKAHPVVVLEMPAPTRMSECHFVGLVAHGLEPRAQAAVGMSVFTLELTVLSDGETSGLLCGWDLNKLQHQNYGRVVEPTVDAFIRAVEELVIAGE